MAIPSHRTFSDSSGGGSSGASVEDEFTAANQLLKGTGAGTMDLLDVAASRIVGRAAAGDLDDLTIAQVRTLLGISAFAETVLDDADAAAARTTLKIGARSLISQRFYGGAISGTLTMVDGLAYAVPFFVGKSRAFDRLAINVTTGGAGSVIRFGIYSDNNGPDALVVDAGTVSSASTAEITATIAQTLDPGTYWLVAVAQGGTMPAVSRTTANDLLGSPSTVGAGSGAALTAAAAVAGALPGTFPAVSSFGSAAGVLIRPT